MEDKRIIHVKDVVEAGLLMNKHFAKYSSIPLRGAIASLDGTVDLSYRSDGHLIKLKVKGIEQILKDGTELDYDSNFGFTRVDDSRERGNWAFICAQNRGRIDNWAECAGISAEKRKLLKPIILVYDASLLTKPDSDSLENVYCVKLPQRLEDRARAILAVYVNHTDHTDDWANAPF